MGRIRCFDGVTDGFINLKDAVVILGEEAVEEGAGGIFHMHRRRRTAGFRLPSKELLEEGRQETETAPGRKE